MTNTNTPLRSGEVWGDPERGLTIRYDVFEYYMNFRVKQRARTSEDGTVLYLGTDKSVYLSHDCDFDSADNVMNGFVKYDGCSHYYFGDSENDGYLHLCDLQRVLAFAWVTEEVFRIAAKEIPQFDASLAGIAE